MKVRGLDGRQYTWKLSGYSPLASDERPWSANHVRARELLEKLFPADQRLEEVELPGTGGLSADFYLPARKLMVEVHGEQHYRQVAFFQKTKWDFFAGQARDRDKAAWCEINGITLVELPHYERNDQWAKRITANGGGEA